MRVGLALVSIALGIEFKLRIEPRSKCIFNWPDEVEWGSGQEPSALSPEP